jgi:hypothetical protein
MHNMDDDDEMKFVNVLGDNVLTGRCVTSVLHIPTTCERWQFDLLHQEFHLVFRRYRPCHLRPH